MKLAEFKPPAGEKPAAPVPIEAPSAVAAAAVEPTQEPQYITATTPSGIEVWYSWEPRRHYKLRDADPEHAGTSSGDWQEVPSVTTVLGVLEKPQLVWWGQGVGVDGTLELVRRRLITESMTKDDVVPLLTEHKLTVNHQKDRAADRGVNVHGALETWVEHGALPDSNDWPEHERGYVEGLYQFLCAIAYSAQDKPEAELMVGSLEHAYAGRFDLVLTLSKPVEVVTRVYPKKPPKIEEIPAGRYLLDLKTSKRVYNTHFLQLEAYEHAAQECGYPATDHRGVIHVTADGRYELVLNRDWCFEDFLAVRKVYSVLNEREILRVLREDLDAVEVKA